MSIFTTLEAFKTTNSLANARKLVAHGRKHPFSLCFLTEDDAGMVREAQRLVDSEASRLVAVNKAIKASKPAISAGEARRIHALLKGRH
jgi:hypothetical protein